MPIEEDTRFPSEKAGLPVIKEISPEKESSLLAGFPFKEPVKIDASVIVNKESFEGGTFNNDVSPADTSVASATYQDVTGATATFTQTINKRRYLLLFNCSIYNTAANSISQITFNIDGTDKGDVIYYQKVYDDAGGDDNIPASNHYVTDELANGSHTFKIRAKVDTGTVGILAPRLTVIEIV